MINISRRFPWMLWPDSICPSFSKDPILQKVQGDKYWKIEVDFENTTNNFSSMKDVFCFVPKCTSLSILENKLVVGLGYDDMNDRVETNYDISPGKIFNITYEHFPKDKLLISIYNNKEFEFNLKDKPLAVADNPVIFLGVNTHITQKESEDIDIIVHNFKIYDTNGIACHHNFKNIIHGKSVDITGNLNFLYQIA
tara:strand:+ start:219 stop:806 length:588 start_codon:yes stop_codon:yes gene_type:complete